MTFPADSSHLQGMDSRASPEPRYLGAARALSIGSAALAWLENTRVPRYLHVFERACNLINERAEVLSIVAFNIGNGPFNLVLADPYPAFMRENHLTAYILIGPDLLTLGGIPIDLRTVRVWFPRPDWQLLQKHRASITGQLRNLQEWIQERVQPDSLLRAAFRPVRDQGKSSWNPLQVCVGSLCSAVASADVEACQRVAHRVAGLGAGLTPAGDDLILGAAYAAWVIHPPELAAAIAGALAESAVPRTTSLSAAWLRAGGRGEASIVWHDFLHAFLTADLTVLHESVLKLLAVGHTSGADALAGFVGCLIRCSSTC